MSIKSLFTAPSGIIMNYRAENKLMYKMFFLKEILYNANERITSEICFKYDKNGHLGLIEYCQDFLCIKIMFEVAHLLEWLQVVVRFWTLHQCCLCLIHPVHSDCFSLASLLCV